MKTAVEWLVEELKSNSIDLTKWHNNLLEQAKEIEKQQIIDAFTNGDCNGTFETINAEQYYNETFKSE